MMNNDQLAKLFLPLFDDLRPEDQFDAVKPLLAHYTSLGTLEKILKSEEVWFSNPLFMNDIEEVRFGILRGVDLAMRSTELASACGNQSRADSFTHALDHYLQRFDKEHLLDTYVLCLSQHEPTDSDGKLSMWRGYGGNGNGAAIVIDATKLTAVGNSPLTIARVNYGTEEERIAWLKQLLQKCGGIIRQASVPDDKLYFSAYYLFERIKLFALFSKHRGFAEEREWRVVYSPDRDPERKLSDSFDYAVGARGVEPKLRLKIAPIKGLTADGFSLSKIVDRIILGPSISTPLARAAVLRMFDRLGRNDLQGRVVSSTIPFRAQ
jgi:hypothetical protein